MSLENELKYTLDRISEWLKFAETKNGLLATANSAFCIGLLSYYGDIANPTDLETMTVFSCMLLLMLSAITSFISFLPIINPDFQTGQGQVANGNIQFFGDIAELKPDAYMGLVITKLGTTANPTLAEADVGKQIVILSKIAKRKFKIFEWAMCLTISAYICPLIVYLIGRAV